MWRRNIFRGIHLLTPTTYENNVIHSCQIRRLQLLSKLRNAQNSCFASNIDLQENIKKNFTEPSHFCQVNSFTFRSHTCGELRQEHIGQRVTLCGWVQYVRLSKFILLRDSYGLTQCIVDDTNVNFNELPLETIVKIKGKVLARPKNMNNPEMKTGEIEVTIESLEILNNVKNLPFNLRTYQKPKEQLRMQYRYVDLRFPEMQKILRQRSLCLHNMRRYLVEKHNFVEVETPTLFCCTPGGAREFIVPTHYSGLFYSLVQSPQQFKQMLMAGGVDRYFQVARCYRDESTRPDRQPEFTQLDIELSFTNLDGVLNMIENLLQETIKDIPKLPFKRMSYKDALENYGSDKPNVTYELKLKNISNLFPEIESQCGVFALPYPSKVGKLTAKYKEKITSFRKKYNTKLVLNENICKEFGTDLAQQIKKITSEQNDIIIAVGKKQNASLCLGNIREMLAPLLESKQLLHIKKSLEPLWIVDFPLFNQGEDGLESCHHPFTAPHPDDMHLLDKDPASVRSLAYDIVLNGNEIGGGSVRIHNSELQERILKMLNIDSSKLAHFINALKSGCPPHAGIALGIDRLMAIICKAESIRDVIAFPKTHEGKDPLSGAPNTVSDEDKKYYNIKSIDV